MDNNKIVFTDWYEVIIILEDKKIEVPVPKFLKELDRGLSKEEYSISFYDDKKEFFITYKGTEYKVILNQTEQEKLESEEYSPLIIKLLLLTSKEKEINDEQALQAVRKTKIDAIIRSNYEDLETVEDYELLLEYLQLALKKSKTPEEKNVNNTKIANVVQIITSMKQEEKEKKENPLNLQMYINKFIYNDLAQVEQLDPKNRGALAQELKKIIIDFRKQVEDYNKKKESGLFLGNPMVPMNILERIIDVEFKIKSVLKSNALSSFVSEQLSELRSELQSIIKSDSGKGKK